MPICSLFQQSPAPTALLPSDTRCPDAPRSGPLPSTELAGTQSCGEPAPSSQTHTACLRGVSAPGFYRPMLHGVGGINTVRTSCAFSPVSSAWQNLWRSGSRRHYSRPVNIQPRPPTLPAVPVHLCPLPSTPDRGTGYVISGSLARSTTASPSPLFPQMQHPPLPYNSPLPSTHTPTAAPAPPSPSESLSARFYIPATPEESRLLLQPPPLPPPPPLTLSVPRPPSWSALPVHHGHVLVPSAYQSTGPP
jgi:hypothetical protein